jgi:hypothetical protein
MYKFQDRKFVHIGKRGGLSSGTVFTVDEGILFRLDWATMRAYFLVDLGTSARMTFLIRKDNIYLTREEPCYYA